MRRTKEILRLTASVPHTSLFISIAITHHPKDWPTTSTTTSKVSKPIAASCQTRGASSIAPYRNHHGHPQPKVVRDSKRFVALYQEKDRASVTHFVKTGIGEQRWIVSYDNVPQIRDLYNGQRHVVYNIGYSARSAAQGSEVMFFCDGLKIPPLIGPIQITEDHAGIYRKMARGRITKSAGPLACASEVRLQRRRARDCPFPSPTKPAGRD